MDTNQQPKRKSGVKIFWGTLIGVGLLTAVAAGNGGDASKSSTTNPESAAPTTYVQPATEPAPTNVAPAETSVPTPEPAATPAPAEPDCANGTYVNSVGNTVCRPEASPSAPAGATAQCEDGTYSFSQSRRGTCSHHGGVARWL